MPATEKIANRTLWRAETPALQIMGQNLHKRLASLETIGVKLGLENISRLLEALQHPEQSFFSILIAGTNGKGSVGAILETILRHHGYRTGHYSSPHLINIEERFRVNGEMISSSDFESYLGVVFQAIDRLLQDRTLQNAPTHFETLTALAFYYFQQKGVEVGVIEVGLGGRFDATNAISQKVSVITTIGFDHEQYLGETLSKIAAEKAAIMKPQTTVVTGILDPEAIRVVAKTAQERNCRLQSLKDADFRLLNLDAEGFPVFEYYPWNEVFHVSLRGKHQTHNACLALLACEALQQWELRVQQELVKQALEQVSWPGRLEIVDGAPRVLLDCAHNPMGVETLAQFLSDFGWEKVVGLFTAMRDKKIDRMLSIMAPKMDTVFLTRVPPYERCAKREELEQAAALARTRHAYEEETHLALQKAASFAREKAIPLVVFGSIYLTGKIMSLLQQQRQEGL